MSTVAIQQQPSYSSPLRPRDSDPGLRTPRAIIRNATSGSDMRRSMSSGASARAAGNNATRSPSGEGLRRNQEHSRSPRGGSKSPGNAPSSYSSKNNNSSNPTSSPNVPIIKKEHPSSPENQTRSSPSGNPMPPSRHRPRKLDLTRNKSVPQGASTVGARPSTKDSAGLNVMHDVGIACLSPGFSTHDPSIQVQLAKSRDIREHQRRLIESQMHGKATGGEKSGGDGAPPSTATFSKPPGSSKRKGPPPGLSINAPSARQFDSEPRVIQSAPLHQTFTGLPKHPSSLSRQIADRQIHNNDSSRPPQSSGHPSNRLPPISDVLPGEGLGSARGPPSGFHAPHSTYSPAHPGASAPLASPGYPPPPASAGLQPPPRSHPSSQPRQPSSQDGFLPPRQREFKSAEDAIQSFSGGREDLQPKLVHYGGHQPPTPPSPRQGDNKAPPTSQPAQYAPRSGSGRRRTREEYERDLADADRMESERELEWERRRAAHAQEERRYGAWEEERRGRPPAPDPSRMFATRMESPESMRRKKEEFMSLCNRAWDLFHS